MKLVIDKSPEGKWRWSLITVNGMTVKIHATGTCILGDDTALAAFNAGWKTAMEKGYVKEENKTP